MDIASITAAYEGLRAGKGILKSLYELKIDADAKARVDDVLLKLGDAQDALFSMREELFRLQTDNQELKEKISKSRDWEAKLAEYKLVKTEGGAVAYEFLGEPMHYACPNCISGEKLQILQTNRTLSGKYRCVACSAEYPIEPKRPRPPAPRLNYPGRDR
ncbi:MAG: hypothetical protein ACRBC3_14200 [Burkholderiaceae bacterium]